MDARALNTLARVGETLDQDAFPCVANGGVVVLNDSAVPTNQSTEASYGRQEKRGPAAGPRQGTNGRQGSAGGPWPSGDAASVIGPSSQAQYEVELRELEEQYPGVQLWHQKGGTWFLTRSQVLPGIRQHAVFLTGISFVAKSVRSWAFWADPVAFPDWIGPRHTNFPDGSICAFEPLDGSWIFGDPLVELLDIYTVWALRHLYLREFGRWPGRQSVHFAGERLLELSGAEHCGCGSGERYSDCCMRDDLAGNRIAISLEFLQMSGGVRRPPDAVEDFVRRRSEAPSLANLVTPFSMLPIHLFNTSRVQVPYPKRRGNRN